MSFLSSAAVTQTAIEKADQAAALKSDRGAFRFYVSNKGNEERRVTFLDGNLTTDGLLDVPSFKEHNLELNGKWFNYFVCLSDNEPCPICSDPAHSRSPAYLIMPMTVVDHTPYVDKNGVTHQFQRKLFMAKRDTFKRLQRIATKRNGLAGITFDISRVGDKSAAVGDTFDFIEKTPLAAFQQAHGLDAENIEPLNYENEIKFRTAEQLRELGFGPAAGLATGDSTGQTAETVGSSLDIENDL